VLRGHGSSTRLSSRFLWDLEEIKLMRAEGSGPSRLEILARVQALRACDSAAWWISSLQHMHSGSAYGY